MRRPQLGRWEQPAQRSLFIGVVGKGVGLERRLWGVGEWEAETGALVLYWGESGPKLCLYGRCHRRPLVCRS